MPYEKMKKCGMSEQQRPGTKGERSMDFFDLVKELRKGEPDVTKAAKAMKILGGICIFGAVWNYGIYYIAPFEKSPFNLPPEYPYLALISLSLLGALYLLSARGIKAMEPWGKKLGQLAVVLMIGLLIGFMFFMFFMTEFSFVRENVPILFMIFSALFLAQFAVPAYFGIRYLGRLPIRQTGYAGPAYRPGTIPKSTEEGFGRESPASRQKHKDSPSPFGVAGTFALLIAVPLFTIMIAQKYAGPEAIPFFFLSAFLLIFVGPALYNQVPSPFENERNPAASYTGGGSMLLFSGSWPFFRLLVYHDGVEIRAMFHRYFIPYDKMDDLPDKIGFFNRGILFKSNLPDVPSGIRFYGSGIKRILKAINEQRSRFMTRSRQQAPYGS
jgi:hypothetical protein